MNAQQQMVLDFHRKMELEWRETPQMLNAQAIARRRALIAEEFSEFISNMSKANGHRREDGKWVKPADYTPADIQGILNEQGVG